jgi:hypothetical protein
LKYVVSGPEVGGGGGTTGCMHWPVALEHTLDVCVLQSVRTVARVYSRVKTPEPSAVSAHAPGPAGSPTSKSSSSLG